MNQWVFKNNSHLYFVHREIRNILFRKLGEGGGQMALQVLILAVTRHILSAFFFLLQLPAALEIIIFFVNETSVVTAIFSWLTWSPVFLITLWFSPSKVNQFALDLKENSLDLDLMVCLVFKCLVNSSYWTIIFGIERICLFDQICSVLCLD